MRIGKLLLCVGGCMAANAVSYGQSFRTDSVQALDEVVVKAMQEVTPHQSINYQQLQNLPSNNVADALKYMAGVQIKDYGGLGGQKTVNGGRSDLSMWAFIWMEYASPMHRTVRWIWANTRSLHWNRFRSSMPTRRRC